jgi:hypothetical protein
MIGSVSSGFWRRRNRNATRAAVAAAPSAAGIRHPWRVDRAAAVREISACGASKARRATRAGRAAGWSWPSWMTTVGRRDCAFGDAAAWAAVATREEPCACAWFISVLRSESLPCLLAAGASATATASGAASTVSEAVVAAASTAGGASAVGAVAAGSIEPAASATAGGAGSAAAGGAGAVRGGSKVSGST